MLDSREKRRRMKNFTTGSRRNARIAATATGIKTGWRNEIPRTTSDPTRITAAAMARKDSEVMAAQKILT